MLFAFFGRLIRVSILQDSVVNKRKLKLVRKVEHGIYHMDMFQSIRCDKTTVSNACDVMCMHMFCIRGRRCFIVDDAALHYFTIN